MKILDRINSPEDVKKLTIDEMKSLAEDIRAGILNRVNTVGGHLGPDLGIVEATIAFHYVFNSPVDKIVFDVSHQVYPHKMITGRKAGFTDPLGNPEISGYTNPAESAHDHFVVGHTSTSVSLATGVAKARDLKGEKYNVIALIGDGSLTGGEAFEGLNNAAVLGSNFIVIVNDNDMSIAENQGAIDKHLKKLRKTRGNAENNLFKAMGYEYLFVEDGNDLESLIDTFKKVKDTDHPVVVHIFTLKGKGYKPAEEDKEPYHWQLPGFLDKKDGSAAPVETYDSITTDYILKKQKENPAIVSISAATPGAIGYSREYRKELGKNYTDVGIAEAHAVAYASGIAKNGGKPVFGVLSSFIQRTYDQLSQDLALNKNPAVILIGWNGISGGDATHLGTFDIPLISNIPNLVYLAPTTKEEYLSMLDWGIEQTSHPVVIRIPSTVVHAEKETEKTFEQLNTYKVEQQGSKVALIAAGSFFELGRRAAAKLAEQGITATLVNPRYLTGLDENLLNSLKADHKIVATLEDGELDGGFGEKIARFYGDSNMKVLNFGAQKEFTDRVPVEELYKRYHLTPELIAADILKAGN